MAGLVFFFVRPLECFFKPHCSIIGQQHSIAFRVGASPKTGELFLLLQIFTTATFWTFHKNITRDGVIITHTLSDRGRGMTPILSTRHRRPRSAVYECGHENQVLNGWTPVCFSMMSSISEATARTTRCMLMVSYQNVILRSAIR